jgi:hypothetical protein
MKSCNQCGGEVNYDILLVDKFRKETDNLITNDYPLGGTILSSLNGTPEAPTKEEWADYKNTYPNRLIATKVHGQIMQLIDANNPRKMPGMNNIKNIIEKSISKKTTINYHVVYTSDLSPEEQFAIRKMMSRYWQNTSVFALELGGAVIRQSQFIDKMHSIDWLHSPHARETMDRLLIKYSRFIQIITDFPTQTAVPTLDVDLGWHTHQLSPKQYFEYTMKKCGKFIDHDDKIDEDALSNAFEWTSITYEKLFQEVYSECTCWYCEGKILHFI